MASRLETTLETMVSRLVITPETPETTPLVETMTTRVVIMETTILVGTSMMVGWTTDRRALPSRAKP